MARNNLEAVRNQITNGLNEYSKSVKESIKALTIKSTEEMLADIQATGPISKRNVSLHMRDSFTYEIKETSSGEVTAIIYSKKKAYIARFLEYGTSRIPAQPFLRPAFDKTVPKFKQELKKIIREGK